MNPVPEIRIRAGNSMSVRPQGDYVLYWMTAYRRLGWNFALQRAVELALELKRPLVVLEILQGDYPYASPRLHKFILEGMGERSRQLESTSVFHYPFVEREAGECRGLLPALSEKACAVVADDFPAFFLPKVVSSAGVSLGSRLEVVDSNGLLPLEATDRVFTAAFHFRRFLQKNLLGYLGRSPDPEPLSRFGSGPEQPGVEREGSGGPVAPFILQRWPPTTGPLLQGNLQALASLPLDRSVPEALLHGGTGPARGRLGRFLEETLHRYHDDRNHPDREATSGLSPYLHFGNISAQEVFAAVTSWEGWTPVRLSDRRDGAREGWWGMRPGAEAFLDQLVTWREVGFNMAALREDHAAYGSLPEWARQTLQEHEGDPRPHVYSYEEFREARTHDPLWNAAQRQLLEEGMIHNFLRMLWGKKILEWTPSAREALEIMMDLNDRFALDGRDPNSTSGIFWCLGRYDRGWPERAVYGKVRSMSSERTRKKVEVEAYLQRFGGKR